MALPALEHVQQRRRPHHAQAGHHTPAELGIESVIHEIMHSPTVFLPLEELQQHLGGAGIEPATFSV
jgi:hypothetical protein